MKIFNRIVLLAGLAVAAIACERDGDDGLTATQLTGAYFNATQTAFKVENGESEYTTWLYRMDTAEARTVALTAEAEGFTVPAEVSFEAGEESVAVTITADEPFAYGAEYKITLSIADNYTTPYGPSSYTFTLTCPPPFKSLGMATYREDFITTFFGADNHVYEVEIQENETNPGEFRLVNPYGEAYPENEEGDWDDTQDYYLVIHAEDPDGVYIETQGVGMDWGYGEFYMGSLAGYYLARGAKTLEELKAEGLTGTYDKEAGLITFPAETLLIAMADYNDGGLYPANTNGAFLIAMPGVVLADNSVEVEYEGRLVAPDNSNYAVANVTLGADVAEVRVAIGEGKDAGAVYDAIVADETEYETLTASGQVKLPVDDGTWTIVAVSYSADGEPQEYDYVTFKVVLGEAETWTALFVGDYEYSLVFTDEDDNPYVDEDLTLYQSDKDPNRYKIAEWGYGVDFVFTFDEETGEVMVEDQETGAEAYGLMIYVDDYSNWADFLQQYGYGDYPGYYDEEEDTFYFGVAYYDVEGVWDAGYETFTLTGYAEDALATRSAVRAEKSLKLGNRVEMKSVKSHKGASLVKDDEIIATKKSAAVKAKAVPMVR